MLDGGDAEEEVSVVIEEDEFEMLDQSEIDGLLQDMEPTPAVGEIDLEELAEITESQESLSEEDVSSLLKMAEPIEGVGESIENKLEDSGQKYETVDTSEVDELEEELKKARELKKIEDEKEIERIKALGKQETNKNKKKPTSEEIEERLIDADEATELDEALFNLKNRNT